MILGRVLAFVFYIIAALIPGITLPVPDNALGSLGRAVGAVGSMFGSMFGSIRNVLLDPTIIINIVTNIPTDINKLLQKFGEFIHFYSARVINIIKEAIKNPRQAYEEVKEWIKANEQLLVRWSRSGVSVIFSLILIKLSMMYLQPKLAGIVVTIAGLKLSIILVITMRMIADKIGELLGNKVFDKGKKIIKKNKVDEV